MRSPCIGLPVAKRAKRGFVHLGYGRSTLKKRARRKVVNSGEQMAMGNVGLWCKQRSALAELAMIKNSDPLYLPGCVQRARLCLSVSDCEVFRKSLCMAGAE